MKPYGLIADVHLHPWSAFSTVNEDGINLRLVGLLEEIKRCANEVKNAGGDTIVVAGDLFHVRGKLAPSVLNPARDLFRQLKLAGIKVVILAGNHDLEGKSSERLTSAITALDDVGAKIVNSVTTGLMALSQIIMIPWIEKIEDLKSEILRVRDSEPNRADVDLIIHAPIDGVIEGLPSHGLDAAWLQGLGFRNVFAGHYHNHKQLAPNVYSIGALAHHSWSDVGSKAGFLIVGDTVRWHKSHLPQFVDVSEASPEDIPLIVDGQFVRAKIVGGKQKDVEGLRAYLTECGALGVTIIQQREATTARTAGVTVKAGASLEVSVGEYVKAQAFDGQEELLTLCAKILETARTKETV
jgi:DNA repair exonuclease SbcCD nuclease subunit